MVCFQYLPVAKVHVNAAGQARIEAANGTHDVDALEVLRSVLFKDRRVLYGILIRSGCAVDIARVRVPRRDGYGW